MFSRILRVSLFFILASAFMVFSPHTYASSATASPLRDLQVGISVAQRDQDYTLTGSFIYNNQAIAGVLMNAQWDFPGGTLWCQATTDQSGKAYCTRNLASFPAGVTVNVTASFQANGQIAAYRTTSFVTAGTPANSGQNPGDAPFIEVIQKNGNYQLTGRMIFNDGHRVAGAVMASEWTIGGDKKYCKAVTDENGKAYCSANISRYGNNTLVHIAASFTWTENGGQRVVYRSLEFRIDKSRASGERQISATVGSLPGVAVQQGVAVAAAPAPGMVVGGATATAKRSAAGTTYTVVQGDNLSKISLRTYGTEHLWACIWHANSQITNPEQLTIGWVLTLPEQSSCGS